MAAPTQDQINTAIVDILTGGQSYSRTGFSLTRASIDALLKFNSLSKAEALRAVGGAGTHSVSAFNGASGSTEASDWGD